MTCYIFGAAACRAAAIQLHTGDMVIAADGGLLHTKAMGITPDLVIGDFDSLGYVPKGCEVVALPVEKDMTDIAAAIDIGRARGYSRFVLYGATGGRPDHTFANYQLLAELATRGEEGYLIGTDFSATAINSGSSLMFDKAFTGTLSVFAVGGKARDVSECGTYYTLEHATLSPINPMGVSNSFCGAEATVSVGEGTLLILWEGDRIPGVQKK